MSARNGGKKVGFFSNRSVPSPGRRNQMVFSLSPASASLNQLAASLAKEHIGSSVKKMPPS